MEITYMNLKNKIREYYEIHYKTIIKIVESTCYGISSVETMSLEEWLEELGILLCRRENARDRLLIAALSQPSEAALGCKLVENKDVGRAQECLYFDSVQKLIIRRAKVPQFHSTDSGIKKSHNIPICRCSGKAR